MADEKNPNNDTRREKILETTTAVLLGITTLLSAWATWVGSLPYTGLYAFPADDVLRAAAVKAAHDASSSIDVFEGRVCSGDQFINTKEQRDEITSSFGGMCCEMEGAAIAQTCYLNNVPFVIIRAISDKPDETKFEDYRVFEPKAAKLCASIVERMIEGV